MSIDWDKPVRLKDDHDAILKDVPRWKNGDPYKGINGQIPCNFKGWLQVFYADQDNLENVPEPEFDYWLTNHSDGSGMTDSFDSLAELRSDGINESGVAFRIRKFPGEPVELVEQVAL